MEFKRRLKLYFIGLGLGVLASVALFGKGCANMAWAPGGRVKKRLAATLVRATPEAQRSLDALHLSLARLRGAMDSCSVDFSDTRRTHDTLFYSLRAELGGNNIAFTVAALRDYDRDSTATLWTIGPKH